MSPQVKERNLNSDGVEFFFVLTVRKTGEQISPLMTFPVSLLILLSSKSANLTSPTESGLSLRHSTQTSMTQGAVSSQYFDNVSSFNLEKKIKIMAIFKKKGLYALTKKQIAKHTRQNPIRG